jgi:acetyltransferase-like isoleucine patch superfamily enzyme
MINSIKRRLFSVLIRFIYRIINSYEYHLLVAQNSVPSFVTEFYHLGSNYNFPEQIIIKNPQYISIGSHFSSLYNLRIEAWDAYMGELFHPEIIIGNNVSFNSDVHIGCINKVVIGDNVLLASKIYISDHSHGRAVAEDIGVAPNQRRLYSKGPVVIEHDVWIGENVSILPNVTIGANAIIGANSVVTRDVPANAIVAGNPARIIRMLAE